MRKSLGHFSLAFLLKINYFSTARVRESHKIRSLVLTFRGIQ